jgi:hypothetical protein
VELVDTTDLKSVEQQCSCGFKSRLGHDKSPSVKDGLFFVHFPWKTSRLVTSKLGI